MAHRYGEPIDVAALVYPETFRWRGRSYAVTRVLRRWRERGSWWADGGPVRPMAKSARAASPGQGQRLECWRVEAGDGEAAPGIFDITRDMDSDVWRLDRVWD